MLSYIVITVSGVSSIVSVIDIVTEQRVVHVECRTTHLKVSGKILHSRIMFTGVDDRNSRKQQGGRHAMETVGIE